MAATIQGIYVALFGRPADPAGLAYFNEETDNGANLDAIGDLTATAEYQARYADMSNEQIINSIYQSLFERDPEQAGLDVYLEGLADGTMTLNSIAIDILNGAQGDDLVAVNLKIAAANLFTSHLDLESEQNAYSGAFAAQVGRDYLDAVDGGEKATANDADAAILRLFPEEGQEPSEGGASGGDAGDLNLRDGKVLLYNGKDFQGAYDDIQDPALWASADVGETVILQDAPLSSSTLNDVLHWYSGGGFPSQAAVALAIEEEGPTTPLPSLAHYLPTNIYLNTPSFSHYQIPPSEGEVGVLAFASEPTTTEMYGTSSNDGMLFVDVAVHSHTANGGGGNDIIVSGSIDPYLLGGGGPIEVYTTLESEFEIGTHTLNGNSGNDIIVSFGGADNHISGEGGNDILISLLNSKDTISGGAGDDILFGGSDPTNFYKVLAEDGDWTPFNDGDLLSGGRGSDRFVYAQQSWADAQGHLFGNLDTSDLIGAGHDTITDFDSGQDKISIIMGDNLGGVLLETDITEYHSYSEVRSAASEWFSHLYAEEHNPETFGIAEAVEVADINVFVASDASYTYAFIDDNADGQYDFQIRFAGATEIDETDFELVDVNDLLDGFQEIIGGIPGVPAGDMLFSI